MTDMDTARALLLLAWIVGVIGIFTTAASWSRFTRYKATAGCVLAVLIAAFLVSVDWWVVKNFVSVKPDRQFYVSQEWGPEKHTLYINNRADDPVYFVTMKMDIITPGVSSETMTVHVDDNPQLHSIPFNDSLIIPEVYWFRGYDKKRTESVLIKLRTIPPHTTCYLTVWSEAKKAAQVRAHVVGFTLRPSGYTASDGKLAIDVPQSDDFHSRSAGFREIEKKESAAH